MSNSTFLFDGLLGPLFIAALLLTALLKILKITEGMAGTFGAMASEYMGKIVGVAGTAAIGVATGGASVALRGGMGSLATRVASSGVMEGLATSESKVGQWMGRRGIELTDKAKAGNWDIRGTAFGKATLGAGAKAVGMDMGKPIKGYEAAQKEQEKADIKFAKRVEVTDAEKRKKAEELEPEYKKAMESREERRKERPAAREKMEQAEKEISSTPEGKDVLKKKGVFDKKDKSAKETREVNKKKIEDLEKQKTEAVLPETREKIDAEIETLKEATADADNLRKIAEQELRSATENLAATAAGKAVDEATKAFKAIDEQIKAADKIIESGDKKAKEWAESVNTDRRERVAQQVEARHKTGTLDVYPVRDGINSRQARETTAKKIRDKEQPKKKDEERTIADLIKEEAKNLKEKEEKEKGDKK